MVLINLICSYSSLISFLKRHPQIKTKKSQEIFQFSTFHPHFDHTTNTIAQQVYILYIILPESPKISHFLIFSQAKQYLSQ